MSWLATIKSLRICLGAPTTRCWLQSAATIWWNCGIRNQVSYYPTDFLMCALNINLDFSPGICLHTYTKHTKAVTACAWLPDNKHFVSGGLDVKVYMWVSKLQSFSWFLLFPLHSLFDPHKKDINGDLVRTWAWNKTQINDLVISPNGRWLAVAGQEKKVRLYDIPRDNPDEDERYAVYLFIYFIYASNNLFFETPYLAWLRMRRSLRCPFRMTADTFWWMWPRRQASRRSICGTWIPGN